MRKLIFIIPMLIAFQLNAINYYVSNTGSDAASGTSIGTAWQTIAKVNTTWTAGNFNAGDHISFNRGDTFYGDIAIKEAGTSGNPITIDAYGTGAKPIITGFTTLSGWTDEGNGIYSKVITSDAQTNMVTIDGVQVAIGRTPNAESYNTYESFSTNVSITDNGLSDATNWMGAEAVIRKNDWGLDRCTITNHIGDVLTYTTSAAPNLTPMAARTYFIQNDLRTLDQFGEWYHNTGTGKFYVYFGAVDPTTKVVKVATKSELIDNNGYSNITVDGISFTGSINNAVDMFYYTGLDNFSVTNCNISFSGNKGIYSYIGTGADITNNTISNCNNAGIQCYGASVNIISNDISNIGLIEGQAIYGAGCSGIVTTGNNCLVQYNDIAYTCYNGIYIGACSNTTVKNNFINHPCSVLTDGGGIYMVGAYTSLLIDQNIILNASAIAAGIYVDVLGSGISITNNTVANCVDYGIFLHNANHITVTDNISFNNGVQFLTSCNSGYSITNCVINDNQFISKESTQYTAEFLTDGGGLIANIGTFNRNYYARPIDDNQTLYIRPNGWGSPDYHYTLAQWQTYMSQDINSYKSPYSIASVNDFQFEYNETSTTKDVTISSRMIDVKGNKYHGKTTLQPFTSLVLIRDLSAPKWLIFGGKTYKL